jgi:hypothetical protein
MHIKKNHIKYSGNMLLSVVIFTCFLNAALPNSWQIVTVNTAAKELLDLNKKILKNTSAYSYNIEYTSYKSHSEITPYQTYKGFVVKEGINIYHKLNMVTTIQNKHLRVIIDSAKQIIKVTNAIKGQNPEFEIEGYIKTLTTCKLIKRSQNTNFVAYRFESKAEKGITAQEIYLGELFLAKMVVYYVNEQHLREDDQLITQTVYPKLEVLITDFKKLNTNNMANFNTNAIVNKVGKKIELTPEYKKFKLFDGRFEK